MIVALSCGHEAVAPDDWDPSRNGHPPEPPTVLSSNLAKWDGEVRCPVCRSGAKRLWRAVLVKR